MERYLQGRDVCRIRRAMGSLIVGALPGMLDRVDRNVKPMTLVACGDMLSPEDARNYQAPIALNARSVLASKIATQLGAAQGANADRDSQRGWGEMCATFYPGLPRTVAEAGAALASINELLNQQAPIAESVASALNACYIMARADAAQPPVPWAEARAYVPEAYERDEVAYQKYAFYKRSMHAVAWSALMTVPNDTEAAIRLLLTVDNTPVIPAALVDPRITPRGAEDYQAAWAALNIAQKLAIFEILYSAAPTNWDSMTTAAVVGTLFSICKVAGCSDAWLTNRLNHVTTAFPDLQLDNKVTREAIDLFVKNYIIRLEDVGPLIAFLQSCYSVLHGSSLQCLSWVIEQARGNNCTHLSAFAAAVVAFNGRPLVLLHLVPDTVRKEFVRACVLAILDPYGTLISPAVPASRYPDYSNFGAIAKQRLDAAFRGYVSTWIAGGAYRQRPLKDIVSACFERMDEEMEFAADPLTCIRGVLPMINFEEINGQFFVYDNTNQVLNLANDALRNAMGEVGDEVVGAPQPVGNPNAAREAGAAGVVLHGVEVPPVEEGARAAWPQRARNLPANAVRVDQGFINRVMDMAIRRDPRVGSLYQLCELVDASFRQSVLRPYGENANNIAIKNRYVVAEQGRVTALIRPWNLTLAEVIPDLTPDADDINYNEQTMDTGTSLLRPARARALYPDVPVRNNDQRQDGVADAQNPPARQDD